MFQPLEMRNSFSGGGGVRNDGRTKPAVFLHEIGLYEIMMDAGR